jgi:trehalose-6-phosphate synthase
MARYGLQCHAVVTMEQVLEILLGAGLIGIEQVQQARHFMEQARTHS